MSESTPVPAGMGWTVTGQTEQTIINPAGQAVNVMAVMFTLADGTSGTVNVPLSSYTAANVRAAIASKAATMAAVNNLAG